MPDMRIARALDDIQLFLGKQMPHGLKLRRLGARVDNLRRFLYNTSRNRQNRVLRFARRWDEKQVIFLQPIRAQ